ncbi:zinc finger MYM-type protein 2-like [Ptychodera flava]|uniref:zinc finger MYM-type protein 2-like n=1 Tax=Ptychodera flava TaxID=63121 RepID=UPI00396A7C6A
MAIERIPKNTLNKNSWAVNTFNFWQNERNKLALDPSFNISVIHPKLEEMTKDELNFALSRFVSEIKKKDGNDYPGQSLYELVMIIQNHLSVMGKSCQFLNDPTFKQLKDTLDCIMKTRSAKGIGTEKRQAMVLSVDDENKFWSRKLIGDFTPQTLLDAQVVLFGINFALRGGQEHRNLRPGQICKKYCEIVGKYYLEYTEDVSKTNSGGLASRKVKRKVTTAFENTDCKERCIVRLYDTYNKLCPSDRPQDVNYLQPAKKITADCWYSTMPVGRNTLMKTVARLCENAGIEGYYTNHSLRATAATRLFADGMDEQLIAEKTGHRSSAIRSYKRTSIEQQFKVSKVLQGRPPKMAKLADFGPGKQSIKEECDEELKCQVEECSNVEIHKENKSSVRYVHFEADLPEGANISLNFDKK